jgi:hypothetical protein
MREKPRDLRARRGRPRLHLRRFRGARPLRRECNMNRAATSLARLDAGVGFQKDDLRVGGSRRSSPLKIIGPHLKKEASDDRTKPRQRE